MDTGPFSGTTISAAGVASIAFANIGLVLLCTIASEMLPPSGNDLIEMFARTVLGFPHEALAEVLKVASEPADSFHVAA
jgi:hypothetical protein